MEDDKVQERDGDGQDWVSVTNGYVGQFYHITKKMNHRKQHKEDTVLLGVVV